MAHYVTAGKEAESDIVYILQYFYCRIESRYRSGRKILLGLVSVIITFEPKPIRVRNIFIWAGVVFWASSRMIKAL